MSIHDLSFSATSSHDVKTYRLLELPPELCKVVQDGISGAGSTTKFVIKGSSKEDAVLCTSDKTYSVRSVDLSNTVLVVTSTEDGNLQIRDQLNEILELTPAVPKLHKLTGLLRGRVYDESEENEDDEPVDRVNYTLADAQAAIQASDAELEQGIKDRRILILNGELRPISPSYLHNFLKILLDTLVAQRTTLVETLGSSLLEEHDVPRQVSTQVMSWFGPINKDDGKWQVDKDALVKEVGIGLLRQYKDTPVDEASFIQEWKEAVGDAFASFAFLTLLVGNYLATAPTKTQKSTLTYFPASSLPSDASARFADLFLTRPRWKVDDITPFLSDIAVNNKERDKLLLKFARATTEGGETWYTARNK